MRLEKKAWLSVIVCAAFLFFGCPEPRIKLNWDKIAISQLAADHLARTNNFCVSSSTVALTSGQTFTENTGILGRDYRIPITNSSANCMEVTSLDTDCEIYIKKFRCYGNDSSGTEASKCVSCSSDPPYQHIVCSATCPEGAFGVWIYGRDALRGTRKECGFIIHVY